ncbi:hypothetical protein WDU94_000433 [Cyamophila willieti]
MVRINLATLFLSLTMLILIEADSGIAAPINTNQTETLPSSLVPPISLSSVPIYLTTALADITINIHTSSPSTLESTEDDVQPFRDLSVETSPQGPGQNKTGSRETNATAETGTNEAATEESESAREGTAQTKAATGEENASAEANHTGLVSDNPSTQLQGTQNIAQTMTSNEITTVSLELQDSTVQTMLLVPQTLCRAAASSSSTDTMSSSSTDDSELIGKAEPLVQDNGSLPAIKPDMMQADDPFPVINNTTPTVLNTSTTEKPDMMQADDPFPVINNTTPTVLNTSTTEKPTVINPSSNIPISLNDPSFNNQVKMANESKPELAKSLTEISSTTGKPADMNNSIESSNKINSDENLVRMVNDINDGPVIMSYNKNNGIVRLNDTGIVGMPYDKINSDSPVGMNNNTKKGIDKMNNNIHHGIVSIVNDTSRMTNNTQNGMDRIVQDAGNGIVKIPYNKTNTDALVKIANDTAISKYGETVSKHGDTMSKHVPRNGGSLVTYWIFLPYTLHAVYYFLVQ